MEASNPCSSVASLAGSFNAKHRWFPVSRLGTHLVPEILSLIQLIMRCQLSPRVLPLAGIRTGSARDVPGKGGHCGSKCLPSARFTGQESKDNLQPSPADRCGGGGGGLQEAAPR